MEQILSWVRSGLLFGIVSSVILMLCPNKSYARHIGLVVGLLFILVMIHPVMELLQIDEDTYITYIRDFFAVTEPGMVSEQNLQLYGKSLAMQVKEALTESGYVIEGIDVDVNEDGSVSRIILILGDTTGNISVLEQYLHEIFGEEAVIQYEGNG